MSRQSQTKKYTKDGQKVCNKAKFQFFNKKDDSHLKIV